MAKRAIPPRLRRETIAHFKGRCAYCRSPDALNRNFYQVDHVLPVVRGGQTVSENLAYACEICNVFKAAQTHGIDPVTNRRTTLFHPRRQNWFRHFDWSENGLYITGRTICGRATIEALQLNNSRLLGFRQIWLRIGAKPPDWEDTAPPLQ